MLSLQWYGTYNDRGLGHFNLLVGTSHTPLIHAASASFGNHDTL